MAKSKVGKRIRTFREEQELALDDVANRTGLDTAFLRALEEDEVYPSLGPLLKVARALGTRLGTFLDDHLSEDPLIVRQTEREEELSMLKGKDKPVSLRFHSLGKGKSDRHMEPFYVEIYPESEPQQLSSHEGEEFIVVVGGQVELVYGENRYFLGPGDSMYYNSIVPHHVGAAGETKAEIYAVMYFPD
ncbi:MAG: helix-turn-helix domain-containing protein [Thermodesulfobacteriota bacterium]